MKQFFNKVSVLALGFAMAFVATACHTGSGDEEIPTTKIAPVVKNAIRGTILDQDGDNLAGATVKINGKSIAVNGNTFDATGLNNGTYKIEVTRNGYKKVEKSVSVSTSTQVIDGESVVVGQDVAKVFYLFKDETRTFKIGYSETESIVLETSRQDDGTGKIVGNTRDPQNASLNTQIVATATTPTLTAEQVKELEKQLPAGKTINDVYFTLTNLTSLEEANITRTIIVAGEALPGNYTFFTGINIGVPFSFGFGDDDLTTDFTFTLPDDVKDCVKLFRNYGSGWSEVTSSTTGHGIKSVDFSSPNRITIKMSTMEAQALALGTQIDQTTPTYSMLPFTSGPRVNPSASPLIIKDLSYVVKKAGIILTNRTSDAMIDYLRKIILRYYNLRAVDEAQDETRYYDFTDGGTRAGFSLAGGGQLFLVGFQTVTTSIISVVNGNSSFQVDEYGDVIVYPYAIVPTPSHGGGSND